MIAKSPLGMSNFERGDEDEWKKTKDRHAEVLVVPGEMIPSLGFRDLARLASCRQVVIPRSSVL